MDLNSVSTSSSFPVASEFSFPSNDDLEGFDVRVLADSKLLTLYLCLELNDDPSLLSPSSSAILREKGLEEHTHTLLALFVNSDVVVFDPPAPACAQGVLSMRIWRLLQTLQVMISFISISWPHSSMKKGGIFFTLVIIFFVLIIIDV